MTEGDGVDLNEIIASLKTDGVTLVENQLTDARFNGLPSLLGALR